MSDTFTIRVQNMSCSACAARAQTALDGVDGVEDAVVSFADESAQFSVDSAKALKGAFAALEKAGYLGALKEDAAAWREEKENDVVSLRRAMLFATALGLPVFILETGSRVFPAMYDAIQNSIGTQTSWQLQSVLTTLLMIGPGLRFYRRGIPALFRAAPDMNSLIALGTGAAYLFSVFVLAAPELMPDQSRFVYFEIVCVITVLTLLSSWLEARAKESISTMSEQSTDMRSDVGPTQERRLPSQALVDRITLRYVPAVSAVAAVTILVWWLMGPEQKLPFMFVAGISVLIIACPCAVGLATAFSIVIGRGRTAELGVMFRTGAALQRLQGATLVVFGTRGILTDARAALINIIPAQGKNRAAALTLVAAEEASFHHPAARATLNAVGVLTLPDGVDGEEMACRGVKGRIEDAQIFVGPHAWLSSLGVDLSEFDEVRAAAECEGQTVIFASEEGAPLAMLTLSEQIKSGARAAIDALHARGVRVALMSGDGQAAVDHRAAKLGIDAVVADVLPGGEIATLDSLRRDGDVVVFVGNGLTDASALAHADIGIAVGTDVVRDAADVVVIDGDPAGIVLAFDASRKTMHNIRQNLFWAFCFNVALLPVAAGMFYPFFGVLLSPGLAMSAMGLSLLFVLSNGLRLHKMNA